MEKPQRISYPWALAVFDTPSIATKLNELFLERKEMLEYRINDILMTLLLDDLLSVEEISINFKKQFFFVIIKEVDCNCKVTWTEEDTINDILSSLTVSKLEKVIWSSALVETISNAIRKIPNEKWSSIQEKVILKLEKEFTPEDY